jgi:hypothetical protein
MDVQQPPAYYQVVEDDTPAPEQIDVSKLFPVTVIPPSGAILIYLEGKSDEAIRFNGPVSEGTIPISGGVIFVQKVDGATDWTLEVLKWQDNAPAK